MRVKTLMKSLVLTLSLGIALSMISVYPLLSVLVLLPTPI